MDTCGRLITITAACLSFLFFNLPENFNRPGRFSAASEAANHELTVCLIGFAPMKPANKAMAEGLTADLAGTLSTVPNIRLITPSQIQKLIPGLRNFHDYRGEMRARLREAFKADFIIGGEAGLTVKETSMPGFVNNPLAGFHILSGHTGKVLAGKKHELNTAIYDPVKKTFGEGKGDSPAFHKAIAGYLLTDLRALMNEVGKKAPEPRPTAMVKEWEQKLGRMKTKPGFQYPAADQAGTILAVESGSPSLPYYLHCPPGYQKNKWSVPLLIFLHGTSARSDRLSARVISQSPLAAITRYQNGVYTYDEAALKNLNQYLKGSFVLMPQLQEEKDPRWKPEPIHKLVLHIIRNYPVDVRRVYVMGISRGGAGCWSYATELYSKIAAVVPICGYSDLVTEASRTWLINTPIWGFHAWDDSNITIDQGGGVFASVLTGDFIPYDTSIWPGYPHLNGAAVNAAPYDCTISVTDGKPSPWVQGVAYPKGKQAFTVFRSGGHNIMGRVYALPDLWKWLYAQSRD